MKILLVDDTAKRRKQIGVLLKKEGYQVIYATNGDTALTRLSKHLIDLVLTDTKMPLLCGPALVDEIKKTKHKNVPIIGMSNRPESRVLYQYFWDKNEPEEILLGLIKKLLAKSP